MNELFGVPTGALAVVLVCALGAALGILAVLALRSRVLVRIGVRNVGRRRARSALIVPGLMLGTTIVAASLATGDTMSRTIRSSAIDVLGQPSWENVTMVVPWLNLAAIFVVVVAVALGATLAPAVRASRTQPEALRYQ